MINKFPLIILCVIFLNLIVANEYIDDIINGEKSNFNIEALETYNINNEQLIFLNGLLQIDGDKAKIVLLNILSLMIIYIMLKLQ